MSRRCFTRSPVDSSEAELLDPLAVDSTRLFDTVVAAYLLDSVRSDFTDAYLAETYLHASLPSAAGEDGAPADAVSIAARGAWLARTLREPLAAALEAQGADAIFTKIRCRSYASSPPWSARACTSTLLASRTVR